MLRKMVAALICAALATTGCASTGGQRIPQPVPGAPLQDKASHLWQLFKPEYPAAIKAAMEMMGRPVGPVRGPMRSLDAAQKQKLHKELEGIGVFDGSEPKGW